MTLGTWYDAAEFLLWWLVAFALLLLYLDHLRPALVAWIHRRGCAMCARAHASRRREVVLWR